MDYLAKLSSKAFKIDLKTISQKEKEEIKKHLDTSKTPSSEPGFKLSNSVEAKLEEAINKSGSK